MKRTLKEEKRLREERAEAEKQARREHPSWLIVKFCKKLGTFPWNDTSNHWGFEEGSKDFLLLVQVVKPPNNLIRKVSVDGTPRELTDLAAMLGPAAEHWPYLQGFRYRESVELIACSVASKVGWQFTVSRVRRAGSSSVASYASWFLSV